MRQGLNEEQIGNVRLYIRTSARTRQHGDEEEHKEQGPKTRMQTDLGTLVHCVLFCLSVSTCARACVCACLFVYR